MPPQPNLMPSQNIFILLTRTNYVPETVLRFFPTTQEYRYSNYPNFTEEATEAHINLLKVSDLVGGRGDSASR